MLVSTIDSIKIYLYPHDHNPPHFHAIYAEYESLIEIHSLTALEGNLPRKQLKRVIDWAGEKQELLLNEFVRLQKSR